MNWSHVSSVRVQKDVVYRELASNALEADMYLPDGGGLRPAVITIHGGGWETDHRGLFEAHLTRLAEHGYVGVDVTHRLSGEAKFPAAIRDVVYCVRWLKRHADEYGVDPARIALAGHSSGAHLAALAAVAPNHWDLSTAGGGNTSSHVAAVVPMNGPYNLAKLGQIDPARLFISGYIRRLFGGRYHDRPDAYRRATVQTHVDGSEPPFLVITSTNDEEVPFHESIQLRDHLTRAGTTAEFHVVDGGSHTWLTAGSDHYETGMERIEEFLETHL